MDGPHRTSAPPPPWGRWSFIFIGLIGVVVVGRVIFCCWKGRQQTTQQVTPVGDIEMVAAAP
ncbi:hypothetical protein F2Q70_00043793 [Brassica cretica]|uniref:Uncharacterized protein n=1 Tax=Brassica cretica TaxID=69181 RepID=A0A8S9KHW3_BRACR|nr:hypothetical protein F2Q70_00043793 [Brassica cretica]